MRSAIALHTVSIWHPRYLHAVNGVQVEKLLLIWREALRPTVAPKPSRCRIAYNRRTRKSSKKSGSGISAPFNALSQGPPPWNVYRIEAHSATVVLATIGWVALI